MRLWAHEEELWACLLTNKHQSAAMVNYVVCGATRNLEHTSLCIQSAVLLQRVYRCLCYDYGLQYNIRFSDPWSNCVIDYASPDDALQNPNLSSPTSYPPTKALVLLR